MFFATQGGCWVYFALHHGLLPPSECIPLHRCLPLHVYITFQPIEAVPRTPWLGYGIQPVSGPRTPCTEGKTPVDARCKPGGSVFRAVKPRIGNRCAASGGLHIRISGINRVLFSYCFREFLRFRSDIHCFDSWRLVRDFSVTVSLTVIYRYVSANRDEDSKVFRNCIDASASSVRQMLQKTNHPTDNKKSSDGQFKIVRKKSSAGQLIAACGK